VVVGGRGSGVPAAASCAQIFGQGVPLGSRSASAFDQNGVNGVDSIDLGLWGADLYSGTYHARSNYDADGDLDSIDLGIFGDVLFGGGSIRSCPTGLCH
jgi:hypothetical protein